MKNLIVGNLKMNLVTLAERETYLESFKKELTGRKFLNSQIVLCPPAIHLESFTTKLENVEIGAQNIFWEDRGSYTGEISAPMVKSIGAEYVIIGHSERRKYFGETNENFNAKIKSAFNSKLTPIYCVGESLENRKAGEVGSVITQQIKNGFADVSPIDVLSIVIAYEPIWAIGSDKIPSSDEILEVRILAKKILAEIYGLEIAEQIKILYGGSVNASNVKQLCLQPGMNGVLVGRESLTPIEFIKIVEIIDKD